MMSENNFSYKTENGIDAMTLDATTSNVFFQNGNMSETEEDSFEREWGFSLEELFKLSLQFYKEKIGKAFQLSYLQKLRLVALTKQASVGSYNAKFMPEVGIFDVVGNDRRKAWQSLGEMSKDSAMSEFVAILDENCGLFRAYVEAHLEEKKEKDRVVMEAEIRNTEKSDDDDNEDENDIDVAEIPVEDVVASLKDSLPERPLFLNGPPFEAESSYRRVVNDARPQVENSKDVKTSMGSENNDSDTQLNSRELEVVDGKAEVSFKQTDDIPNDNSDKIFEHLNPEAEEEALILSLQSEVENDKLTHKTEVNVDNVSSGTLGCADIEERETLPADNIESPKVVDSSNTEPIQSDLNKGEDASKCLKTENVAAENVPLSECFSQPQCLPNTSITKPEAIPPGFMLDLQSLILSVDPEQRAGIQSALNAQTSPHFKLYAQQQHPDDEQKQQFLISQLQEQHFLQYMQQIYQMQVQQQMQMLKLEQQQTPVVNVTKNSNDALNDTASTSNEPSEKEETHFAPIDASETSIASSEDNVRPTVFGDALETTDDAAATDSEAQPGEAMVEIEGKEDDDEDDEDRGSRSEEYPMVDIAAASMWTRKDIREFKDVLKNSGDSESIINVGHGETVTIRVPTHPEGACLFWEFATDHYDLGFGLYFEWSAPDSVVSIQVSDSSGEDEDDTAVDEGEVAVDGRGRKTSKESKSKKSSAKREPPPCDEIIPVYRRDSNEDVYCGSHVYPGQGVYLLKFDNSYSLWRSKNLYYRVYYTR